MESNTALARAAGIVMLTTESAKDAKRSVVHAHRNAEMILADRIPQKHLCVLEAGISTKQTDEMRRQSLTLVVPSGLHATYMAAQLAGMLSVTEFVEFVRRKQT